MIGSEYKEWVSSAHEQYLSAKKLLTGDDPPNEPYKSKYTACKIITQLKTELESKWKSNPILQVKLLSNLFNYELGVIAVETEEKTTGCDLLTACLEEIGGIKENPECCFLALSILNQLGVLWSERGETEKALSYLLDAETLYTKYKTTNETCPFILEDIFLMENSEKSTWEEFEKRFTYTAYFLAQVYGHMEEVEKSAKYCRETLRRQKESGEFVNIEWVKNCYTLAEYYTQKSQYQDAKHLLTCAGNILYKYELKAEKEHEGSEGEWWTEVHQHKATLSCCWLKYAIAVLSDSHSDENKDDEKFCRLLEDEEIATMENRIPHRLKNLQDAKNLFLYTQNHASVAQSFFTLEDYASDYAQIARDHSKLYKALAALDPDVSRQCKLHKRRFDLLDELLNKLNPQFYLAVCRQLQFELGEICHEMLDLKTRQGENGLTLQLGMKINHFATKGIGYFLKFLQSLKDKNGMFPDAFSEDIVRPALIAHFYIAKYFYKIIEGSDNRKIHNLQKAHLKYSFIVKYVEKNPQHACFVEKELPLIKEMLELIPEKILHITGSTVF